MNSITRLDNFDIPDHLSEADAEYFRTKISRCTNDKAVEKYRKQLKIIEECLRIAHKERIKNHNV